LIQVLDEILVFRAGFFFFALLFFRVKLSIDL